MTVKCIAVKLTEEQRAKLGGTPHIRSVYELSEGHEYTVLGILFVVQSALGSTPLFSVKDDAGRCYSVPTCLFEILDPRPSKWWIAKQLNMFDLALWPEEFYREYFHDDLSDGVPEKVAAFDGLISRLETEFFQ